MALTQSEVHDYLIWRAYRAQELLKRPEVKALWERRKPRNREEAVLLQEIQEGLDAREQILLENLSLVYEVAHRYRLQARTAGVPLEELVQQGALGFLEALDRFDPRSGHRLSTWVYYQIRWRIQQTLQGCRPHLSLDEEHPDTGIPYGDTVAAKGPGPAETAERKALKAWWNQAVPGLLELVESGDTPNEAASRLGTSLKRLKKELGEEAALWV
ncbi:sigma-70 family RNA polymerase sigma factor [Fervidobacterium sp.]